MLLSEIKLNIKQSKGRRSYIPTVKKADLLGNGIQTLVYAHEKYPNSAMKITAVPDMSDGAVQFLRVCVNHQDNPFFPKIYAYKLVRPKELEPDDIEYLNSIAARRIAGAKFYLVSVVEKLQPAPAEVVTDTLKSMGIDWEGMYGATTLKKAFDTFLMRREMVIQCNNPDFIKAMRLLEPLFQNHFVDLHEGNFMLRGSQLVINDPVVS